MALREEKIQNCDSDGINEAVITKVNQECKSSSNKPSESVIYSLTNNAVKKEPRCSLFFTVDHSIDTIEDTKEIVAKSSIEESQQPVYQQEESLGPNFTEAIKEEVHSLSEESGGSIQFSCLTPNISQTSSSESPIAIKYNADMKCDSHGEESHLSSSSKKYYTSPPSTSKRKLRNTKRRAGILYKQITSSKLCKVTSKYFSQAQNNKKRWIPPRSPYALVQEDLFDNPWQLLVATIFLTKTTAKKALPQFHKFIARYPRPEDVLKANYEDVDEYFKPLGLTTTRSHIVMRFTVEFLEKDWTYPRELYGIGKYGDDSYRMFCINEWRQVSPDDIPLTMYRNWLAENAERLGVE